MPHKATKNHMYYCPVCDKMHHSTSKIGKKHGNGFKFDEVFE